MRLKNNSFKFPVARLSFSSLVHDIDALISYFSLILSDTGRERRWKCCTRTKPTRTVRIQRQRKWGVKIQFVNCDEWRASERTNERENRVSERAICWVKRCERAIPWHAARQLRLVSSLPLLPFIKNVEMVNFQQTKAKMSDVQSCAPYTINMTDEWCHWFETDYTHAHFLCCGWLEKWNSFPHFCWLDGYLWWIYDLWLETNQTFFNFFF